MTEDDTSDCTRDDRQTASRLRPPRAVTRAVRAAVLIAIVVVLAGFATGSAVPGTSVAVDVASDVSGTVASAAPVPAAGGGSGGGRPLPAPSGSNGDASGGRVPAVRAGGPDSDGDGLTDELEREIGTAISDRDTDGDGFTDGEELRCQESIPGADPLRQDVYVELDATAGARVNETALRLVERTFADAPVGNPDGTTGIDLHVVRSDTALSANSTVYSGRRPGPRNDLGDFRHGTFDRRGDGHVYVLATGDVAYRDDEYYAGTGRPGVAAIETFDDSRLTASLLMHELGHAFGLSASRDGVDEKTYTVQEYPSVMNYNALYKRLSYSAGDGELGRDEWEYVAEQRHVPALSCSA